MAAYNNNTDIRADEGHNPYTDHGKSARMVSLADELRGLEKQCGCLREDVQRLTMLLTETREELAMLSQRTFGNEPSR